MKRKKIVTDQDYAEFRIDNIVDVIKSKQYKTLLSVNSKILELFWSIGGLLNNALYEKKSTPAQLIREGVAATLMPVYGTCFSAENLSIMQDFSNVCSCVKLQAITSKVSWKYIRVLNQLQDPNAWTHYILLMYKKSLTPDQLQDLIDKDTPTFKDGAEQDLHYLRIDHKDLHHRMIMDVDLFFKEEANDFRSLLIPKEKVSYTGLKDELEVKLLSDIQERVYAFQALCYDALQSRLNYAFQEIGREVSTASVAIATTMTQDEVLNKVITQLNNRYLDKAWLLACLKFAEAYQNEFADFLDLVSFAHIKVLLTVADKLERERYATVAYEKRLTPEQLATYIAEGKTSPKPVSDLTKTPEPPEKIRKVISKKGNIKVVTTVLAVEQQISTEPDMNMNIFANMDITAFLKDA
ncbi:DUF1016 N-terminal domain-containing protein [Pedobacter sp. ASV28]|uniref:DUF1016 N-terminal domain-containing protein n=1 Tax=Pedobacter sp. ASV28 TaxID=2795123 RepID=UPI0018ED1068|nr:DUF1016 N-terminal domain-containing protein [Pedobacter sp. ASV28]